MYVICIAVALQNATILAKKMRIKCMLWPHQLFFCPISWYIFEIVFRCTGHTLPLLTSSWCLDDITVSHILKAATKWIRYQEMCISFCRPSQDAWTEPKIRRVYRNIIFDFEGAKTAYGNHPMCHCWRNRNGNISSVQTKTTLSWRLIETTIISVSVI